MTQYVLGFLFDQWKDHVVLINKNRPEWQKGQLNGVGGKIEEGELPHDAMVREFEEETGLKVPHWDYVCQMRSIDWSVLVFTAISGKMFHVTSKTDEEILICDVLRLPYQTISNVRWLVPLCLDTAIQIQPVITIK